MKLFRLMLFIGLLTIGGNLPAEARHKAASTAVSALSDTTDRDDAEDSMAEDTTFYLHPGINRVHIVNHSFNPDDFFGNLFAIPSAIASAFGLGGTLFALFALFIVVSVFLFPIALVVLILYLLLRDHDKKAPKAQHMDGGAQAQNPTPVQGKEGDKAILHIAIGAGIAVFFAVIGVRTGIGIGLMIVCFGIGEYLIARREKKRNNNEQNHKEE